MKTVKIEKIEEYDFIGEVYNLELVSNDPDNDDLFWVNGQTGIVTHNCFPKDLNAMVNLAKRNGIDPKVMQAVWDKNNEVRPEAERDWEKMKGRAVSD